MVRGPKLGNRLLDSLPETVLRRLKPHLRAVPLRFGETLYETGQKPEEVFFPTRGMISVVATMQDGAAVEVGVAGNDGMASIAVVLGDDAPIQRAIVQMEGTALAMKAATLRQQIKTNPALMALLLRYVQTVLNTAAQSAACNRLHPLERRCARWLLMALDRSPDRSIHLTHEFLAVMLGVRRPGVTVAAKALQASGIITYTRGTITVLDRPALERGSCECYQLVAAEYERLIGNAAKS